MKLKPRVLIFSGYGLNCEEETAYAFDLAGATADIVHINDLIDGLKHLSGYDILTFPGGFSYGDDIGSGNAFANKIRNHLWKDVQNFIKKDKLILGICNGFQIMVNLGLVPVVGGKYGLEEAALVHNDSARYTVCWVDLSVENKSPWFKGIGQISLPVAHGEGRFFAPPEVLSCLQERGLVAARYANGSNPNGSLDNIAAITDRTGRILGMMPHPERAIFFTQLPSWMFLKEKRKRAGKKIPRYGPGLKIFQNAVRYFA